MRNTAISTVFNMFYIPQQFNTKKNKRKVEDYVSCMKLIMIDFQFNCINTYDILCIFVGIICIIKLLNLFNIFKLFKTFLNSKLRTSTHDLCLLDKLFSYSCEVELN